MNKNTGKAIASVGWYMLGTGIVGKFFFDGPVRIFLDRVEVAGGVLWISGTCLDIAVTTLMEE